MSIRDMLPFLQARKITHKVNGVAVTIYAMPLSIIYELKSIIRPLARSISTLTENHLTDVGCKTVEFKDDSVPRPGEEDNNVKMVGQINREALTVEMAELREKQKTIAIDNIIEAITVPANQHLLGKILLSSLKDIFKGEIQNDDITEFMNLIDIGSTVDLIEGIFKVNSGAFAPLWGRVQRSIKDRLDPIQDQTESLTEDETEKKSPSEILKEKTLG